MQVTVNGTIYGEDKLVSLRIERMLCPEASVGSVCYGSAIVSLLVDSADIPRQAEVSIDGVGRYYIGRRSREDDVLTLTCYDPLRKGDAPWSADHLTFPAAEETVAADICTALGMRLSADTKLLGESVKYPSTSTTIREQLSKLAVANCGNWCVDDTGALRLVPYAGCGEPSALSRSQCGKIKLGLPDRAVTGVRLYEDGGNLVGSAGSETGRVLELTHLDGTDTMAASILSCAEQRQLVPFTVTDAILPYVVPLGQLLTYNETTLVPHTVSAEYVPAGGYWLQSIEGYGAGEDDEFPYTTKSVTAYRRATNAKAVASEIERKVDSITLSVTGSGSSAVIALQVKDGDSVINLSSGTIRITGFVAFGDLANSNSYTQINGGNLVTGTVKADMLRGQTVDLIDSVGSSVGQMVLVDTSTGDGVEIDSYAGMRISSGLGEGTAGNIYLAACDSDGAEQSHILIGADGTIALVGGKLVLGSQLYGSTPPGNPAAGQVYFRKVT